MGAYVDLRRRYGLRPSPEQEVIANGIQVIADATYWTREQVASTFGCDPGKRLLGFVGRLEQQKGLDVLLGALSVLPHDTAATFELLVVGDGGQRSELERQASRLGCRVTFTGAHPQARLLLPAFDLLVIPSRFEGMPLVAIEAQMAGSAPLVSDCAELIGVFPPDWTRRFPNGNASALSEKIREWAEGTVKQTYPAPALRNWADRYDARTMAAKYLSAYEHFLASGQTR